MVDTNLNKSGFLFYAELPISWRDVGMESGQPGDRVRNWATLTVSPDGYSPNSRERGLWVASGG